MGRKIVLRTRIEQNCVSLAALNAYVADSFGITVDKLPPALLDALLAAMETGVLPLGKDCSSKNVL